MFNWLIRPLIIFGLIVLSYNGCKDAFTEKEIKHVSCKEINFSFAKENRYIQIDSGFVLNEFVMEKVSSRIAKNVMLNAYYALFDLKNYQAFLALDIISRKDSTLKLNNKKRLM